MDREAWHAGIHGVTKSRTRLSDWTELNWTVKAQWMLVIKIMSLLYIRYTIRSDQSLSRVRLFATPWIPACQASLSITNSQSSLRLMSIESVMPSSHLISSVIPFSSCPQSLPASESFLMSQLFTSGGQITGASASASVLPMNIQGWFPLGLTGLISFCPRGSQESLPIPQFKSITSLALNILYGSTLTSIHD